MDIQKIFCLSAFLQAKSVENKGGSRIIHAGYSSDPPHRHQCVQLV